MDQRKRSGQSPITSTRFAFGLIFRFSSVIRPTLRYTLRAFGIANRRLIPNDISLPFQLHSLSIPNMPQGLMRAVHTAIHPNSSNSGQQLRNQVRGRRPDGVFDQQLACDKVAPCMVYCGASAFRYYNLSADSDFLLLLLLERPSLAIRHVAQRVAFSLWIYLTDSCHYRAIYCTRSDR